MEEKICVTRKREQSIRLLRKKVQMQGARSKSVKVTRINNLPFASITAPENLSQYQLKEWLVGKVLSRFKMTKTKFFCFSS